MATDICISPQSSLVEVVARTDMVDVPFMMRLIDQVADAVAGAQRRRVLLEVIAPACRVSIIDRVDIWNHAVQRKLFPVKIAHVITGRPIGIEERFKEDFATNRGITVRTFAERVPARAWLEAGG